MRNFIIKRLDVENILIPDILTSLLPWRNIIYGKHEEGYDYHNCHLTGINTTYQTSEFGATYTYIRSPVIMHYEVCPCSKYTISFDKDLFCFNFDNTESLSGCWHLWSYMMEKIGVPGENHKPWIGVWFVLDKKKISTK